MSKGERKTNYGYRRERLIGEGKTDKKIAGDIDKESRKTTK